VSLNTQQYVKKPSRLEVVELTKDNLVQVATWCGGRINDIRNVMSDTGNTSSIGVPSLYGAIDAEIGSFIAREVETGKFLVMTKEHLDHEYQRVGLRQDGIFGNQNGKR
jgi:hypothetical protein